MTKQQQYTVIGIYDDNEQRFAGLYEADTPQEAEYLAQQEAEAQGCHLIIAGSSRAPTTWTPECISKRPRPQWRTSRR